MTEIYGEWKNFVFKKVLPEDYSRILKHLRDCLYYSALYRLGYEKYMDDETDQLFAKSLKEEQDLCLFAEDKNTGKVACVRVVCPEYKNPPPENPNFPTHSVLKSIIKFYYDILAEGKIFEIYDYEMIPHMFGLSTDPEYQQQGLATEMYRRSKLMIQAAGHQVAIVGYISPYSRAAGTKNGYKETSRRHLRSANNVETGEVLNPNANPEDFMDMGVFEL